MRERLRLNFSFRFRKEVTPSRVFYFLIFYYPKKSTSSFYIPSYIGAPMHIMHVRVQKKNVCHLALMCYMWHLPSLYELTLVSLSLSDSFPFKSHSYQYVCVL